MTITMEDYELLQRYQKLSTLSEALDLYYYEDVDQEVVENGAAYGWWPAWAIPIPPT